MNAVTRSTMLVEVLMTLLFASTANATTLTVNCGAHGGLNSIGAALKVLQSGESHGPATINVSGACKENVVIQSMDRLTLNAASGTSITDVSGGMLNVMAVDKSSTVDVNGFTFNGGQGVICGTNSACTFAANTFQGSVGDGVSFFYSFGNLRSGNIIQNNTGRGLVVHAGAVVRTFDLKIQHNDAGGATAIAGGNLTFFNSSSINNGGDGIQVLAHSTARMDSGFTIQGNGGHGIRVQSASEASLGDGSISDSGGAGVEIGDLSFVWFRGQVTLTGSHGGTDVECLPQSSATRGVLASIGNGTTNCVEPTEEGLFATQIQLDSTETPAGNPTLVRAFIPTGSDSEVCFVNLGDSGFYLGTFAPTTCIRRTYLGQKGLVVILSTTGWELPGDFVMRVSVYQKGATSYGQPIPWND